MSTTVRDVTHPARYDMRPTANTSIDPAVEASSGNVLHGLAGAFHAAPLGMALLCADELTYKDVNARYSQLTRYPREMLIGSSICDGRMFDKETIRRALALPENETIREIEAQLVTSEGTWRTVEISVSALPEGNDLILMLNDVTERKAIEEALAGSHDWMELILNTVPLSLSWKDRNGVYLGANKAACRSMGYENSQDIFGMTDDVLPWTAEEKTMYESAARQVVESGNPQHDVIEPQRQAGGRDAWMKTSRFPLRDRQGTVVAVLSVREDVTELVRAGEELRRSEERYQRFVSTTTEAIACFEMSEPISVDSEEEAQPEMIFERMCLSECNDAFARMYDASRTLDLIGKMGRDFQSWSPALGEALGEFVHCGYRLQNWHLTDSGRGDTPRHVVLNLNGEVQDRKLVRIWVCSSEVTKTTELRQRLVDMLEMQLRQVGHDLHDGIGQLLTGIRIMSEHLADRLKADGSSHAERAARLADLVRDAMYHARNTYRGLAPVQLETEGLAAALNDLALKLNESTGVACAITCEDGADMEDSEKATHLFRIVQESVNNAVRHGKATHIDIELRRDERGKLVLTISDNGKGFAPDRARAGGMGLKGMKYRAATLSGRLHISSRPGEGSVIHCVV